MVRIPKLSCHIIRNINKSIFAFLLSINHIIVLSWNNLIKVQEQDFSFQSMTPPKLKWSTSPHTVLLYMIQTNIPLPHGRTPTYPPTPPLLQTDVTYFACSSNSALISVMVSSACAFPAMDLIKRVAMRADAICSLPIIHMSFAISCLLLSTAQMNTSRYGVGNGSYLRRGLAEKREMRNSGHNA